MDINATLAQRAYGQKLQPKADEKPTQAPDLAKAAETFAQTMQRGEATAQAEDSEAAAEDASDDAEAEVHDAAGYAEDETGGLIDAAIVEELNTKLLSYHVSSGRDVHVVLGMSTDGRDVEEVAEDAPPVVRLELARVQRVDAHDVVEVARTQRPHAGDPVRRATYFRPLGHRSTGCPGSASNSTSRSPNRAAICGAK